MASCRSSASLCPKRVSRDLPAAGGIGQPLDRKAVAERISPFNYTWSAGQRERFDPDFTRVQKRMPSHCTFLL